MKKIIMGAAVAAILSTSALAEEKEDKCISFNNGVNTSNQIFTKNEVTAKINDNGEIIVKVKALSNTSIIYTNMYLCNSK